MKKSFQPFNSLHFGHDPFLMSDVLQPAELRSHDFYLTGLPGRHERAIFACQPRTVKLSLPIAPVELGPCASKLIINNG